jgi:hypothetical protein
VSTPLNEVQVMQNPALGAGVIWRFCCGFGPDGSGRGAPLPLVFVVLPIVFHARTLTEAVGTQAGSSLRKLEDKFRTRSDVLWQLQPRMIAMRELSLRSLRICISSGLATLIPKQGTLWPRSYSPIALPPSASSSALKAAEKLGGWCAELTLFEIAGILKVEF